VRLIRLGDGERLTGIERVAAGLESGDDVVGPGGDDNSSVGESGSDEASPV
jgi:hypothetical protein